jgi:hypothetical protein
MNKIVRFVDADDGFWSSSSAHSSFSSLDEATSAIYNERVTMPPRLPIRKDSCEILDNDFSEAEEEGENDSASATRREKVRIRPRTILRKTSRYSSTPPIESTPQRCHKNFQDLLFTKNERERLAATHYISTPNVKLYNNYVTKVGPKRNRKNLSVQIQG